MKSDVQDAIQRARTHLRAAARESIEASRALIDAALLAGGLEERDGLAADVSSALDSWIAAIDEDRAVRMPRAFMEPLEQAIEGEIDRWEKRSATDDTARPVLRAFLGLRELLWELGMRSPDNEERHPPRDESTEPGTNARPDPDPVSRKTARSRVQRFDLDD